jgi:hypothetical protein
MSVTDHSESRPAKLKMAHVVLYSVPKYSFVTVDRDQ